MWLEYALIVQDPVNILSSSSTLVLILLFLFQSQEIQSQMSDFEVIINFLKVWLIMYKTVCSCSQVPLKTFFKLFQSFT